MILYSSAYRYPDYDEYGMIDLRNKYNNDDNDYYDDDDSYYDDNDYYED